VEIIHVALHKALKQAVRWSLVPRNVAEAVTPPRPPKREITPLTHQQLRALLEAVRNDGSQSGELCVGSVRNDE